MTDPVSERAVLEPEKPRPAQRIMQGLKEAEAFARGDEPAAALTINGHTYVPQAKLAAAETEINGLRTYIATFEGVGKAREGNLKRACAERDENRRLVDLAHSYLREALKLDAGEPMRFDYYAHLIDGLHAKLATAQEALRHAAHALDPFADSGIHSLDDNEDIPDDEKCVLTYHRVTDYTLTVKDFREAMRVKRMVDDLLPDHAVPATGEGKDNG